MPVPTQFGVLASGHGGGGSSTTLNPLDCSSSISLAAGNLRATRNTVTPPRWVSVRSTTSKTTGKVYVEATVIISVANIHTDGDGVGFANTSFAIDNGVSDCYLGNDPGENSVGITTDGILRQGGPAAIISGTAWGVAGDICGVAVDIGARLMWFRKSPAGIWNANPSANPATGVGGYALAGGLASGPLFVGACAVNGVTPDTVQINFGSTAFSGAIPAGFSAWG